MADEFKYINLGPEIASEFEVGLTSMAHIRQLEILKWLDDNRDRLPAPAKTISNSEYHEIVDDMTPDEVQSWTGGFLAAGGTIAEETNAEKLLPFVKAIREDDELDPDESDEYWACRLDAAGVRAPDAPEIDPKRLATVLSRHEIDVTDPEGVEKLARELIADGVRVARGYGREQ